MVTNVTNFGRSGVSDWVVQRVSAIILAVYTLFMLFWTMSHPELQYAQWNELFQGTGMRVFTLLALLSLVAHAWIGVWTISTDYLTSLTFGKAATVVRFLFQVACAIIVFVYLAWGIEILWS